MNKGGLILASASTARNDLLTAAGVPFHCRPSSVDEAPLKAALRQKGADTAMAAGELATAKALEVSARHGAAHVIGADQILDLEGTWFDKPADLVQAEAQLKNLRGKTHTLVGATVVIRDGRELWRHLDHTRMTMRNFSDRFLAEYLSRCGAEILESVGAYRLEGQGAQLFSAIEGDYFSILGLPLLPLLDYLRRQGLAGD